MLNSIRVFAFNYETNEPVIGDAANITCTVSRDGAAAVPLAASAQEEGLGYYRFELATGESTADNTLDYTPSSSTPRVVVLLINYNRQVLLSNEYVRVKDLLEANRYIDKSSIPWREVFIKRDTGDLANGERLIVRELYSITGKPVDSIATFIAAAVQPT